MNYQKRQCDDCTTVMVVVGVFLVTISSGEQTNQNLIPNIRPTVSTSMSADLVYGSNNWNSSQAIDGKAEYEADSCDCCSSTRTADGVTPWWQLDLGAIYLLSGFVVYGRDDYNNHYQFGGFAVNVSNSTMAGQGGNLVYTDNGTDTSIYYFHIQLPSPSLLQYVMISLNVTGLRDWLRVLTICEVKVYEGDCALATYGDLCGRRCHCFNHMACNKVFGTCPPGGCQPGWKGAACDTVCTNRTYGVNCDETCGHCMNQEPCHIRTGNCARGCDSLYSGPGCLKYDTTKPTKKTTTPPSNTTPRPASQKPDKDDYIGCYAVNTETTCPPVHALGISWPRTEAGKLATVDCGQGQAKWRCQKNPVVCWKDEPDIKQCTSEEIQELTQQADEILTTEDNTDLTISFTDGLATTLANDSISEQDMFQSTKLMATAAKANAKNKTSAKKIIKNVVRCGNSLVASNKQSTWKNMEKATQRAVASSLLDSMEMVSMELIKIFDTPGVEKIEEDNMAVELHVVDVDQLDTPGRSDIVYEGEENTFSIPLATLKQFSSGGLARLVFIDYKNIAAMLTPEEEDTTASDDEAPGVISQVLGASIDGGNDEKLAKNVVFTFQTNHTGTSENWKQTCSFWNFSLGYTGAWSGRGCSFVRANETHTTCECDHLTNFAILLDVHSTKMADVHAITLSYITYIGIIISITCLFLSWVTFVCLSTVQGERNTIHKHLVFCMFVAEILFLTGIERTDKKVACSIIAGFLHFFFLGSFMWMFMEGIHILFMLVQVFDAARSRLKYYYIMGYGGPLLTVGVSALVYYEGYGTEQYCWLTTDRWFIWSFAGPVAFILLVNLIILIYALSAVCKHSEYVFSKDKSPSGNLKGWVQGALALEVLLGLTWVFGYFYISEEAIVVAYLFTIFNSLQGVFIFIFHCLLNKKVRKEYQHFIEYMAPSTGTHTTSKSGGHQNGVPLASRKQSDFSNINLKMSRAGSTTRL